MNARIAAILLTLALPAAGCVTLPDTDARFAAGWRPSRGYCAFGAETARVGAWCADLNFGREGLLVIARDINASVLARAAGKRLACEQHVARVRVEIAAYGDYTASEVYSCDAEPPLEGGRPVCHVSLLVTSPSGWRVVLDNGHVLEPAATGGVAPYAEFSALVDRHWVGRRPDGLALAAQPDSRKRSTRYPFQ